MSGGRPSGLPSMEKRGWSHSPQRSAQLRNGGVEVSLQRKSLLSFFPFFPFSLLRFLFLNKIFILGGWVVSRKYLLFRERDNTNYLGVGSRKKKIKQGCSELAGRWRSAFTVESLAFQNSPCARTYSQLCIPPPPHPSPLSPPCSPYPQGLSPRPRDTFKGFLVEQLISEDKSCLS